MQAPSTTGRARWAARPLLTFLVRALVLAVPVVAGLGAGALASELLPEAHGAARIAWLVAVLGAATVATLGADVLARRLLPLTALLRLTLAFPDHAPSRLRVALRASNVRRLQTRVQSPEHADLPDAERAVDIVALAAALNSHDRRTRGHSERVQALTRLVAEELHLDADERDRLGWAAFLHDIGKLEVPRAILNKSGPLDDDEWAVLKRHPAEGARLIAPLGAWLGDAAHAIDEHHEHFDGTGYPRGLAGDEISRAGRIVAVTDAFETITAARSYKRPASPAEGRAELTRCAGTHFDPHVVRAFLDVSLGRLRWVLGFGSWFALVPVLGATRVRAAALRLRSLPRWSRSPT
ncbi:MAG: HD-GYP domain-containing protein [Acidimicrobiia bacterium]